MSRHSRSEERSVILPVASKPTSRVMPFEKEIGTRQTTKGKHNQVRVRIVYPGLGCRIQVLRPMTRVNA
jgi:hypothetical protein